MKKIYIAAAILVAVALTESFRKLQLVNRGVEEAKVVKSK